MLSLPPPKAPQRLTRWLVLLATCAAPLLAQANNCTSPNANADYILGAADGTASAMHWPTGLVWKRCVEGMAFNSANGQCTGTPTTNNWHTWANAYLPQPFTNQANWGVTVTDNPNRLVSGDWRMAYQNGWVSWVLTSELSSTIQNCGVGPKVNRTVFPNTPSDLFVWSGSPSAGAFYAAWIMGFSNGGVYSSYRTDDFLVRLVRAGQPFAALTSPAAQTGAAGATVIFPAFTLAASDPTGQAWGGARISGDGSPAFRVNNTGDWVQEAIVKSTDQITVRLKAPATGSNTATFTLRSGQTTGTKADGSNGGSEATEMKETEATFTASPRYTKIANNGAELLDTATLGTDASDWACTRDNATGKIWEVKTDDNGLRSQEHTYTWFDSYSTDGNPGTYNGGTCAATGRCDTEKYTQDVNAISLCGATDWRMPSKDELGDIVDGARSNPAINPDFFPNTLSWLFWSGSPYAAGSSSNAWGANFYNGDVGYNYRSSSSHVRLVRAGQSLAPVLSAPTVSSITHNSASVQATSNLAGTGYWLVQAQGGEAPTPALVRASGQSFAMTANAPATISLLGLNANTAYDFYLVAEDADTKQLSAPAQQVLFTTAPAPVNGACATVAASATEPTTGLCSAGTASAITGSNNQWTWGCNGLHGGSNTAADACTAPYASQSLSISASPTTIIVGATSAISASSTAAGLTVALAASGDCSLSGNTATGTAQGSCTITASQAGTGDTGVYRYLPATDAAVTLTVNAAPVDASCGAAAGVATATAPTAGLCAAGTPGLVATADGQHSWQCTGLAGGSDAGCMAPGIAAAGGTGSMTLAITGGAGCQIESVTAAAPPAGGPTGFSMPYGVLDFAVNSCTGTSVSLQATFSGSVAGMSYKKYIGGNWIDLPATLSGNTAIFTIVDNDEFDADPTPGRIQDPSGPAVFALPATAVPTLSGWALLLMSSLLGLFGYRQLRRKPQ